MVYTYNETLFNFKKEISITCYSVNEPWGCHTRWNKGVKKRQIQAYFRDSEGSVPDEFNKTTTAIKWVTQFFSFFSSACKIYIYTIV